MPVCVGPRRSKSKSIVRFPPSEAWKYWVKSRRSRLSKVLSGGTLASMWDWAIASIVAAAEYSFLIQEQKPSGHEDRYERDELNGASHPITLPNGSRLSCGAEHEESQT